jgi:hypothetical protein
MTLKDFRFPSSTLRGLEKQAIIISTNGYTWDTPVTFSRMEALCTEPLPKDQTSAKRGFNSSIQYVTDFLQPVGSAIILSLDHSLSSRSKVSGLGSLLAFTSIAQSTNHSHRLEVTERLELGQS